MKKILDLIRIPATILSALGLAYTIYIHLHAIDYVDLSGGDNIPGYLTTGIFAVWAAAIGVAIMRQKELKVENHNSAARLKIFWLSLFGDAPTVVIIISLAVFLYGNYYGWTYSFEGIAGIIDGKRVLHNHGQIIKELTDAEFLQYEAEQIRYSTSNSMTFYGVATGILFPRLKKV